MDSQKLKLNLKNELENKDLLEEDEPNKNWFEVRLQGKVPERRGYHSTFLHQDYMYIYGGHDIREGSMDNMWVINLNRFSDLDMPPEEMDHSLEWKMVETKGGQPGAIKGHTSVVNDKNMYMFGGSRASGAENDQFYCFHIDKKTWEQLKPKAGKYWPESRDEHSACINNNHMVIFGGFERGVRQNSMLTYNFESGDWEIIAPATDVEPSPRAGHSATVYNGKMYVFGGKDEDNEKLKDLWSFDFDTRVWFLVFSDSSDGLVSRSGHSAQVFGDFMLIFGGIHEVTKELDDMIAFDFKKGEWIHLFSEYVAAPVHELQSTEKPKRKHTTGGDDRASSPDRTQTGNNSPAKIMRQKTTLDKKQESMELVPKSANKKKKSDKITYPKRKVTTHETQAKEILQDATSITMMGSFFIKNSGPCFDNYAKAIAAKKKMSFPGQSGPTMQINATANTDKQSASLTGMGGGSIITNTITGEKKMLYGKAGNRRPAARDGHTGMIHKGRFIVFGGDRHSMPFNDLHFLNIGAEFEERALN